MMHELDTTTYAGDSGKVPGSARLDLKARRVAALRDVARAALAYADHLEQGGEVPLRWRQTPYVQAINRADEQLLNYPSEIAPCECRMPEGHEDFDTLLPPTPGCTKCHGSGDIEYWTPALDSSPLLFGDDE